ncbi:uncharacterized protein TOT_040000290 [Theileria orientalis strain Shintoku]|uniref:PIG-P domain-containing protein n=1 Tax=Theileria orientalis strain Shintoku TaxID=869250 RepID=J4DAD8_THEOR|nr:uncharacterized protein TOT_040000290 [Theileria orientalis strain Shintoku]BAM41910.1 uncharacterized protein TOT_040000290 [Theileria orientalis strain Shintoku]|eukprot:XP_009692211.1 uncharacterized protein TOT_040000290 [Theileria orientalis strain Shintoku]
MDFDIKSFVSVLLSYVLFVLYVVWAYVPDRYLNKIGLVYYPSKHWSCSFPIFLVFTVATIIVCVGFHEKTMHPRLDSYDSMIDEYSAFVKGDTVTCMDTPLNIVNRKLYSNVSTNDTD